MSAATGVRPRVVIIWLLLLGLIGAIAYIKYLDRVAVPMASDETQAKSARMLLPMSINDVAALEIFHAGVLHRFERDKAGQWFYHVHGAAKTNDASHAHQTDSAQATLIGTAFSGFSRTHMEREFPRGNEAEYGLTTPEMFVLLYGKNTAQLLDKFTVGSLAPDGLSRYIASNNYPKVLTIANYQIENLLNLVKSISPASK
jgi:hypothetical protein